MPYSKPFLHAQQKGLAITFYLLLTKVHLLTLPHTLTSYPSPVTLSHSWHIRDYSTMVEDPKA